MSPMAFPLMSSLVRDVLLPRALRTMERSAFSLESASDSDISGCRGTKRGGVLYAGKFGEFQNQTAAEAERESNPSL